MSIPQQNFQTALKFGNTPWSFRGIISNANATFKFASAIIIFFNKADRDDTIATVLSADWISNWVNFTGNARLHRLFHVGGGRILAPKR
jgi:hypothetical protein